jgi:hypothetical protein
VSAASDGRSSGRTVCARPVWPRWRYLRGNAEWLKGDWKVNFWCPGPAVGRRQRAVGLPGQGRSQGSAPTDGDLRKDLVQLHDIK